MRMAAYLMSCKGREALRQRTLDSLHAGGWQWPVHVAVDASRAERPQERQCETAHGMLQRAIEDAPDWIVFLEDDLEFNRRFADNLLAWPPLVSLPRGAHFFGSLYNPTIRVAERCDECDFFIAATEAVYGSQAFVLSLPTARMLAAAWHTVPGMQDIKMSRLAAQVTPLYYHVPSLVQHVGQSTWGGSAHTATDFSASWCADAAPAFCTAAVLRRSILQQARRIDGWLSDEEADLLLECAVQAGPGAGMGATIVDVGSYCGRSTVLFGLARKWLGSGRSRVVAIDAHDGRVMMPGDRVVALEPTLQRFESNVAGADLADIVVSIVAQPSQVAWHDSIDLLFVDGLHDYDSVAADFGHFSPWIRRGGRAAFHDCAPHFPGVQRVVADAVASGSFILADTAGSLAVLERQ